MGFQGRIAFAVQADLSLAHERILTRVGKERCETRSYPVHRVWAARAWAGANPDNYCWHDQSAKYLSRSNGKIIASFYLQPGKRMLLALSDWDAETQSTEITLNLAALGFEGKALAAEDAITGEPIDIRGGAFSLDVKGDGFRLIKIWSS